MTKVNEWGSSKIRKEKSAALKTSIAKFLVNKYSLTIVDEFSNFSKNFQSKTPKTQENLQNFLNMFEENKAEGEFDFKDEDSVVVSDFFTLEKGFGFKTEAFYCTKISQVKGTLLINTQYMKFEPLECPENDIFVTFASLTLSRRKGPRFQSSKRSLTMGTW